MRKLGFYPGLAAQTIRRNARLYLPYFFSCVGAAAMYYILLFLQRNEGLQHMRGTVYVQEWLFIGSFVVALFSMAVLFYTNSFLMKRRQKELGLYNVLGMGKRHVARIMLWETVYTALICVVGGVAVGALLSKLTLLLLCSMARFPIRFGFEISMPAVAQTAIMFCAILALNLLLNLLRMRRARPVELLRAGRVAEREPKTTWLLIVLGVLALGGGYFIALSIPSPIEALALFFPAAVLVIIGTFCLFTAASIAVLKLLRGNKAYYYKTSHFITVSGMLHRMKRNAAGLATICILCTMVLVTISTTFGLYAGAEDSINGFYPYQITLSYEDAGEGVGEAAQSVIRMRAKEKGLTLTHLSQTTSLEMYAAVDGDALTPIVSYTDADAQLRLITAESYTSLTGEPIALREGEALLNVTSGVKQLPECFSLAGVPLQIKAYIDSFPMRTRMNVLMDKCGFFVVTKADLLAVKAAMDAMGEAFREHIITNVNVEIDADEEGQTAFYETLCEALSHANGGAYTDEAGVSHPVTYADLNASCRVYGSQEFYGMYGGFFFLGIFLGILFLMATTLIIYYKQVSEGYEDAERYRIMRQIGLSEKEVRGSIRTQILMVFFLPLLMAGVHIVFAFGMITWLFVIFGLFNKPLFALCCLVIFLAFALIYALIYALTAKAYYRIVRG